MVKIISLLFLYYSYFKHVKFFLFLKKKNTNLYNNNMKLFQFFFFFWKFQMNMSNVQNQFHQNFMTMKPLVMYYCWFEKLLNALRIKKILL